MPRIKDALRRDACGFYWASYPARPGSPRAPASARSARLAHPCALLAPLWERGGRMSGLAFASVFQVSLLPADFILFLVTC